MNDLINIAKELLESKKVNIIIGYEGAKDKTRPVFITNPEEAVKLVFNNYSINNLSVYLSRKDIKDKGKIGIVAKGCDVKSIIMLIKESQIKREDVYIIGMNCEGVAEDFGREFPNFIAAKCARCKLHTPEIYDVLLGEQKAAGEYTGKFFEELKRIGALNAEERFDFWEKEFNKCIRCYACRQACPLCYCTECIADKSMPQWIESSSHGRGNFAWNLIRAFHLAGRCIGCNECERVCPVNIPLSLLNWKMGMTAMQEFNYLAGIDINQPTLVGNYNNEDREDFIK
jgi:formate dehydrogenase (coenzyme F420) beta subunit